MLVMESMEAKRSRNLAQTAAIMVMVMKCFLFPVFVHTSGIQVTAKKSFILIQCSWKHVLAVKTDKELVELLLGSTSNVIVILGFEICVFWSKLVPQASLLDL
jgi:hypothetical protein